jgi:hypothetical protein
MCSQACQHCLQPMQSLGDQLQGWIKPMGKSLLELMSGCSLPMTDDAEQPRLTHHSQVRCRNSVANSGECSHLYCSHECEAAEFNQGHRLLCLDNPELLPKHRQSLVRFQKHAASNQESFALAAKLIAKLCVPVR